MTSMRFAARILLVPMVGLVACAWSPDPRQMVRVGYMERDCSEVRNNDQIPAVPIGLRVTPVEAARALPRGCDTKFFMSVYADTENYYFFDNTRDVMSFQRRTAEKVKRCSYVVDGHSASLVQELDSGWKCKQ